MGPGLSPAGTVNDGAEQTSGERGLGIYPPPPSLIGRGLLSGEASPQNFWDAHKRLAVGSHGGYTVAGAAELG